MKGSGDSSTDIAFIASHEGTKLFSLLRSIDIGKRREIIKSVYNMKLSQWKSDRRFNNGGMHMFV